MTEKKDKPSPEPPKREPQTLREELENSLVEYLMPYSDTLIQVQERFTQFAVTVGAGLVELQKQMKPFLEGFQAVVHKLAQVDWTAVIDAHEKSSIHIADCGWTMPDWIGLSEFYTLYGKSQDELDRYFTDGFMENEGEKLKALGERLSHMQSLSQWHPLLEDIVASILAGRHYVAIPATLTVMEGYLSNALVKASLVREGNTIPFKALEKAKWHEQDTFDAIFWRGGVRFLSRIFADSRFHTTAADIRQSPLDTARQSTR